MLKDLPKRLFAGEVKSATKSLFDPTDYNVEYILFSFFFQRILSLFENIENKGINLIKLPEMLLGKILGYIFNTDIAPDFEKAEESHSNFKFIEKKNKQ